MQTTVLYCVITKATASKAKALNAVATLCYKFLFHIFFASRTVTHFDDIYTLCRLCKLTTINIITIYTLLVEN